MYIDWEKALLPFYFQRLKEEEKSKKKRPKKEKSVLEERKTQAIMSY